MSEPRRSYRYHQRITPLLRQGILVFVPDESIGIINEQRYRECVKAFRLPDKTLSATFDFSHGNESATIMGEVNGAPATKEVLLRVAEMVFDYKPHQWVDISDTPSIPAVTRDPPRYKPPQFIPMFN